MTQYLLDDLPNFKPHFTAPSPPKPTYQPDRQIKTSMALTSSSGLTPPTTYSSGRLSAGSMTSTSSVARHQGSIRSISVNSPKPPAKSKFSMPRSPRGRGRDKEKDPSHNVYWPAQSSSSDEENQLISEARSKAEGKIGRWDVDADALEKTVKGHVHLLPPHLCMLLILSGLRLQRKWKRKWRDGWWSCHNLPQKQGSIYLWGMIQCTSFYHNISTNQIQNYTTNWAH